MTDRLPALFNDLPASLVDIAEALGVEIVKKLVAGFGGLELRIPVNPGSEHPIIKALGETDGRALCHYLAGQKVYVPHVRPARSARAEVLALEAEGRDIVEIARALGMSQRHVRRILNETPDKRQLRLFE